MRNVYPTDNIAHLWIHAAQDSARNPGQNFYFSGPTLYSYGSHFVCGHIMPREHYGACVLVNSAGYSNTTSKHMQNTRHAIPSSFREIYVNGLSDNDTRYSTGERGARDVCAKLLAEFRAAVANAATVKNVRAGTRGANLATAITRLADLRFLLECDAKRKIAYARPMLRALPTVADVPTVSDMTAKDARATTEAFASKVLREQYREELQRITQSVDLALGYASAYVAGNIEQDYAHSAHHALTRANDARLLANGARHAAKLGKARVPASVTAAAKALPALVETLTAMDAKETRAKNVGRYASAHIELREILATDAGNWRARDRLQEMRRAGNALASLDSEAEKQARMDEIETCRAAIESDETATAETRALRMMQLAGENFRADKLDDAARLARMAEKLDAGRAPDCADMLAAVDARAAHLDAERIAAWRNGASVRMNHDREAGALLRIVDGKIETSWGADVPVSVAPMVWQAVSRCRDAGTAHEFDRNQAPRLGHFTMDKIDADGSIHVGCHFIRYAELQGIAAALNF